jgi:large subunit ribosomal protein L2
MKNLSLSNTKPHKGLIEILKKHSGRDNKGTISVRHQGARQKRYYRIIDFRRDKRNMTATVLQVEYDPNRNAHIALVQYEDGEKRYMLHPKDLAVGQTVVSGESIEIRTGNATALKNVPLGIEIHNVEFAPNQGGTMIRGAGTAGVVIAKDGGYVQVKLPSGEVRKFFENCWATIGRVGNIEHKDEILGKAGRKRLMGIRPTVRGVAQHPGSHPHGGGEGRSGEGMHPKTPWGKSARGTRTRNRKRWSKKLIVSKAK